MKTRTHGAGARWILLAVAAALPGCGRDDAASPRSGAPAPSAGTAPPGASPSSGSPVSRDAAPSPEAPAAAPPAATSLDAFFEAVERGDDAAALAALPVDARTPSPYDAGTEALPVATRDNALYARLAARLDEAQPVPAASRAAAALPFALGCIAHRKGEWETARRALHVALLRDPLHRLAHLYLARVYRTLEEAAMRTPEARGAGAILAEKVGAGSSDTHIEMAQEIVDKTFPEPVGALDVTFTIDAGTIRDVKTAAKTASGNARMQRSSVAAPEAGSFRAALVGADHEVLDERWFAPVERLHVDGNGPGGKPEGGHSDRATFTAAIELLAPRAGERVLFFDAAGKRIAEAKVR